MQADPMVMMADMFVRLVVIEAVKVATWLIPLAGLLYLHARWVKR